MPFSSRESPRSGVNVVGLRPSLIAQHSLRGIHLSIHSQGEGSFSVINDGRSPGKTPSLGGDSRGKNENQSHEKHKMHEKLLWRGILFCGFSCPFVAIPHCSSFAQCSMFSSRESPRSGVNVVGLRPSLIAQHSLRGIHLSIHSQGEGSFSVINDGRSPGKTPSLGGDSRAKTLRLATP